MDWETMEQEMYEATQKLLPQFCRGEWEDIPPCGLDALFEVARDDYRLSGRRKPVKCVRLSKAWADDDFTGAVMIRSYPAEPLKLSVARLAKAVGYLGYEEITPFTAAVAYATFKSLGRELAK